MGVSKRGECRIAHGHQLDEEEEKDRHEAYSLRPVVLCYRAREARVRKGIAGGGEEVNERSGYDDAGAKVFGDEERPFRNPDASVSICVYRECGTCTLYVSDTSGRCGAGGMLRILPNSEPNSITKIAETRRPIRPSKSFSGAHAGVVVNATAAAEDADGSVPRATTLATACTPSTIPPLHRVESIVPRDIDCNKSPRPMDFSLLQRGLAFPRSAACPAIRVGKVR